MSSSQKINEMKNVLGLLKVKVIRGINLVYRDTNGSDPYVILRFGRQEVFDKDTFTRDDEMGDAEFGIRPLVDCAQMNLEGMADGSVIRSVLPYRHNCLLKESPIVWKDGTLTQDVALKLRNVESGEIELQLQWVWIPSSAHSL
ncbi:putative C2 domain-containing protein [Dioscorea sansibarensis]